MYEKQDPQDSGWKREIQGKLHNVAIYNIIAEGKEAEVNRKGEGAEIKGSRKFGPPPQSLTNIWT